MKFTKIIDAFITAIALIIIWYVIMPGDVSATAIAVKFILSVIACCGSIIQKITGIPTFLRNVIRGIFRLLGDHLIPAVDSANQRFVAWGINVDPEITQDITYNSFLYRQSTTYGDIAGKVKILRDQTTIQLALALFAILVMNLLIGAQAAHFHDLTAFLFGQLFSYWMYLTISHLFKFDYDHADDVKSINFFSIFNLVFALVQLYIILFYHDIFMPNMSGLFTDISIIRIRPFIIHLNIAQILGFILLVVALAFFGRACINIGKINEYRILTSACDPKAPVYDSHCDHCKFYSTDRCPLYRDKPHANGTTPPPQDQPPAGDSAEQE